MTRRKFLALGVGMLALPAGMTAQAFVEPRQLRVKKLVLNPGGALRFVHFTDFHYKGDAAYAEHVIRTINELEPEFVCFTGDLVEDAHFAPAALAFIREIKAPVFGAPGNHDYRCGAAFPLFRDAFAATGGDWLVDRATVLPQRDFEIVGMGAVGIHALRPPLATRRLLLLHYPQMSDSLGPPKFDLILAGHSHGGQIRLPFYGAPVLPWGVGRYDLGYFESKGGPLYVNPGIGTYQIPWRFNCRPEVTLVSL
ncbi:MAG: metallophosphoesterase [Verrucomicrobiaceae bacterium]|nr:metallophosphoesterase [Verrucomicrobiaceae bacterium]